MEGGHKEPLVLDHLYLHAVQGDRVGALLHQCAFSLRCISVIRNNGEECHMMHVPCSCALGGINDGEFSSSDRCKGEHNIEQLVKCEHLHNSAVHLKPQTQWYVRVLSCNFSALL